jgi:hypothetical protein
MTKYIIEIPDGVPYVLLRRVDFGITKVVPVADLEELNSDYINEHYGELQDEAYQRGFEDGRKAVSDPGRIEVGDEVIDKDGDTTIVTNIHERLFDGLCSDGSTMGDLFLEDVRKTGKHYDIASILEAMRTHD